MIEKHLMEILTEEYFLNIKERSEKMQETNSKLYS